MWGTRPGFPARRLGVGDLPMDNSEVSVSLSVKWEHEVLPTLKARREFPYCVPTLRPTKSGL